MLTAFDRHHAPLFRRQFLATLRRGGNPEPVTAVGYGLFPTDRRLLASIPGVELLARPQDVDVPAIRRLSDFQTALLDMLASGEHGPQ